MRYYEKKTFQFLEGYQPMKDSTREQIERLKTCTDITEAEKLRLQIKANARMIAHADRVFGYIPDGEDTLKRLYSKKVKGRYVQKTNIVINIEKLPKRTRYLLGRLSVLLYGIDAIHCFQEVDTFI